MSDHASAARLIIRQVSKRIVELRAERGLTQEALAERADLSARYVQLIEAGKENMTISTLAKLGRALHVPAAELLRPPSRRSAASAGRRTRSAKR